MNSRNIVLSGVALAVLVAMLTFSSAPIALAVPVGTGVTPQGMLTVFTIKKAALICDSGASAPQDQNPPEIGGCVDVYNPDEGVSGSHNVTDNRFNEYLFSGEQLAELVVARDLNGAQFQSSTANLMVDGSSKVTCRQYPDADAARLASGSETWFGHNVRDLLQILPPAQGVSDTTGYNQSFDKIYECILTVTPAMVGSPSSVNVQVSDVAGNTATTDVQKWYMNPAISISVSFDSGSAITFPAAQAGQTVYSTNTLMIKNTAAGGVDLAVYLAGNDLVDQSGIGKCPVSNILSINNMGYRCKVGTYMSEEYTPLQNLNTKQECDSLKDRQCLVDGKEHQYNDLLPDASDAFTSILYNGHTAECWFSLTIPLPCIGSFSAGNAVDILVRAI